MNSNTQYPIIYLPQLGQDGTLHSATEIYWLANNDSSPHNLQRDSLEGLVQSLKDNPAASQCIVVIPGIYVLSSKLRLPGKQARKAIPFLLEERLATPLESTHISTVHSDRDSALTLSIDHSLLTNLLASLKAQGINPTAVLPDYALLPDSDRIQYVNLDDRTLCKLPTGEGFSLNTGEPDSFDPALLSSSDASSLNPTAPSKEPQLLDLDLQRLLFHAPKAANNANLLTGSFKPQTAPHNLQLARQLGLGLAASLVIFLSYSWIMGWQFGQKADDYYLQAENHYRQLFPEAQRITNLRRQFQGKLRGSLSSTHGGDTSFLQLLNQVTPAINQPGRYRIQQVRFDQAQQTLQLELQSNNLEHLQQLQRSLSEQQLKAQIKSANAINNGVQARLTVSRS